MRSRLGRIENDYGTMVMGSLHDRFDIRHLARHIRNMTQTHNGDIPESQFFVDRLLVDSTIDPRRNCRGP
jgi:hypothetical protein